MLKQCWPTVGQLSADSRPTVNENYSSPLQTAISDKMSVKLFHQFITHTLCNILYLEMFQINLKSKLMTNYGPSDNERFSLGVLAIRILMDGNLLVGAGDGTVAIMKIVKRKFKKIQ